MWIRFLLAINFIILSLNAHELINLREHNPHFRFANNQPMFLVREAAVQLSRVQADLAKEGIALVILRAYVPESESPSCCVDVDHDRISHTFSRGTAVDVSLEYISGNPLQLPCPPYSWFIDPEWEGQSNCCHSCALQYLERAMLRHRFNRSDKVWWHFEYRCWRDYPPMDIPLYQLIYSQSSLKSKF